MKYLSSFLVLFLISGVGGFDLVIDDIPDVSIWRQGPGLPCLLKSIRKLQWEQNWVTASQFSSTFNCKYSENWSSSVICSVVFLILLKLG